MQRRFGTIGVEPADKRYGPRFAIVGIRPAVVWKDLFHFPQAPRIKDGRVWWPADSAGMNLNYRVLERLDSFPSGWRKGECVFRMIEPQWFIPMCWAAV